MLIGWTTLPEASQAEALASAIIQTGLAVCVQLEGPVRSFYYWEAKVEQATEYRLCIKFLENQQSRLEAYIHQHHPYQVPEWVVCQSEHVAEKYLSWAAANSTNPPL